MKKRLLFGIALGVLLLAGIVLAARTARTAENAEPAHTSVVFSSMGTVGRFDWYGADEKSRGAATDAALGTFREVVAACNLRDEKSELSRLNASAHEKPFICSPLLWDILAQARAIYRETDGVFDVSVKPLMDLWGFYRKRKSVPSDGEIETARALVGLDKIVFDDGRRGVFFPAKGMALDLDGIAKGYALDLAAEAAKKAGVDAGALDLGGNLRLLDPPGGGKNFSVGIKSPGDAARTVRRPELADVPGNVGISTSGNYERFTVLDGKKYGHILDPATGRPAEFRYSVTVIAPTAARADGLSTALYLAPERAPEFRKKGIAVVLVSPDEK